MLQFKNNLLLIITGILCATVHHLPLALDNNRSLLIGSNVTTRLRPYDMDGFYLNTARPAPRNGTITAFSYCFYGSRNTLPVHQSLVALYRPREGRIMTYERVSDTFVISNQTAFSRGFNCTSYLLDVGLQVQQGDLIGACIYDTSTVGQLDLISESSINESYNLLSESVHHADCDTGVLPDRIPGDALERTMQKVILHVSAEIQADFAPNTDEIDANMAATLPQATELPATQGRSTSNRIWIIIVVVIGGLVFIAIMALIVVIIVVVSCLVIQRRCDDEKNKFGFTENTAYTIASRDSITQNLGHRNRATSEDGSIESSQPYYDYILNSATRGLQLGCNGNKDCVVEENVAYTGSPDTLLKSESKPPSKDDEYVMFVP